MKRSADGRADVADAHADAHAGTRVALLGGYCTDNPVFARPIDVTAIVRPLADDRTEAIPRTPRQSLREQARAGAVQRAAATGVVTR